MNRDQLDQVVAFSSFIEALSDPKGLKDLLDKTQKVLDQEKAQAGPKATVAGADAYKAKVEEDLQKQADGLQAEKDAFAANVKSKEARLAQQTDQTYALQSELAVALETAKQNLVEQDKVTAKLKKDVADYEVKKAQLTQDQADLVEKEQALVDKANQLKQLMGS